MEEAQIIAETIAQALAQQEANLLASIEEFCEGPTGPVGESGISIEYFGFTGMTASMLVYPTETLGITGATGIYYSNAIEYVNPGTTANPHFIVTGDFLPSETNKYSLGKVGSTWSEIVVGPGTIVFTTETGSTALASIGANIAGIVYTENGFATPYIMQEQQAPRDMQLGLKMVARVHLFL